MQKTIKKSEPFTEKRKQEFITVIGTTIMLCDYLNRLRDENKRPFLISSYVISSSTAKKDEPTNEVITGIISIIND